MRTNARTWYPRMFIVAALAAFSGLAVLFLWPNSTEQHPATQAAGAGRRSTEKDVLVFLDVRSGTSPENATEDDWSNAFAARLTAAMSQQGIRFTSNPSAEGVHTIELLLVKTVTDSSVSISIDPKSKVLRPGQSRNTMFGAGTIQLTSGFNAKADDIPRGTPEADIRDLLVPSLADNFAKELTPLLRQR